MLVSNIIRLLEPTHFVFYRDRLIGFVGLLGPVVIPILCSEFWHRFVGLSAVALLFLFCFSGCVWVTHHVLCNHGIIHPTLRHNSTKHLMYCLQSSTHPTIAVLQSIGRSSHLGLIRIFLSDFHWGPLLVYLLLLLLTRRSKS